MTTTPEQQRVVPSEGADDDQEAAEPPPPSPPAGAAPTGPADLADPIAPIIPIDLADPADATDTTDTTSRAAPADAAAPDPDTPDPDTPADPPEQMTSQQTAPPQLPADPAAEGGSTVARNPRDAPRWVRWTVFPLLVLVPAGYLAVSALQSRDSGETIQQLAAARQLTMVAPTPLQRRIYEVSIPRGSKHVGFLETNSWDTSVLDVQFTTTPGGLDTFLSKVGTSRAALSEGWDAITPAQAEGPGWSFPATRSWAGAQLHQAGDKPDHDIMVDLTDEAAPKVYVVSTVNFQHGFGGG